MEISPILPLFAIVALTVAVCWLVMRTAPKSDPAVLRRVQDIEDRWKTIELQWNDSYDKLNRLAGRLTKERGLRDKSNPDDVPIRAATGGGRASLLIARKDPPNAG